MTPQTTSSSRSSVIRVAHAGTPREKLFVPSIRSMTHRTPASSPFLLAEEALVRTAVGDPLPECALDRPVGVRQRR
jgi:hypothetical protein